MPVGRGTLQRNYSQNKNFLSELWLCSWQEFMLCTNFRSWRPKLEGGLFFEYLCGLERQKQGARDSEAVVIVIAVQFEGL